MSIMLIARGRGDFPVTAFPDMESATEKMDTLCDELPLNRESQKKYVVEGDRAEQRQNAADVLSEMFGFIDRHGDAPTTYYLVETEGEIGQFAYVD